jgi:hypothetical protein
MKNYHVVRNVIDPQTIDLVKKTMLIMKNSQYFVHRIPQTDHNAFADGQPVDHDCWGNYGTPVTEALLLQCLPLVEEVFQIKVHPTYSFCRIYFNGADMKKHTDRPSCEYSISLNISNDPSPWPIYFEGEPLLLETGDAVVYKGCEVEHWREQFNGNEQYQVFLHYVNQAGPHASNVMDGRPMLGLYHPPKKPE